MAQPNSGTITNAPQTIHNEAALVGDVPAVAGFQALQQAMQANHLQFMAALGNTQAQLRQLQGQVGQLQGQFGQLQGQFGQLGIEYDFVPNLAG